MYQGNNVRNALHILVGDRDNKLKKLMSYVGSDRDVSDPWYTDDFSTAYRDIYTGCKGFVVSKNGGLD